jgi:hypothetical protein
VEGTLTPTKVEGTLKTIDTSSLAPLLAPQKSDEVRSRTLKEWTSRYLFTSLASASLFGIYDAARLPLSSYVVELFSGGIDSCIGSSDFDLCTTVFLLDNDVELGAR